MNEKRKSRANRDGPTWRDIREWHEVWIASIVALGAVILTALEVVEVPYLLLRAGILIPGVLLFARWKSVGTERDSQLIDAEIDHWHRRFLPWGIAAFVILTAAGIWAQAT